MVKNSLASAGYIRDAGSIAGLGRSPGEGNGSPLQNPCLENSMDGEAWQATVHGVTKSRTRLSHFTSLHIYINIYDYVCYIHTHTYVYIQKAREDTVPIFEKNLDNYFDMYNMKKSYTI